MYWFEDKKPSTKKIVTSYLKDWLDLLEKARDNPVQDNLNSLYIHIIRMKEKLDKIQIEMSLPEPKIDLAFYNKHIKGSMTMIERSKMILEYSITAINQDKVKIRRTQKGAKDKYTEMKKLENADPSIRFSKLGKLIDKISKIKELQKDLLEDYQYTITELNQILKNRKKNKDREFPDKEYRIEENDIIKELNKNIRKFEDAIKKLEQLYQGNENVKEYSSFLSEIENTLNNVLDKNVRSKKKEIELQSPYC